MAGSKIVRPEFTTDTKTLSTISANYLLGDVTKAGYKAVGIIAIDGSGIASTNSIRLFYLSGDNSARVGFVQTPTSGSSVTATILYQRN